MQYVDRRRVGLDVELLEKTQQSILKLFSAEEVERAVHSGNGGGGSAVSSQCGGNAEEYDPALSSAIADLHKFSMMQVWGWVRGG